MPAEDAHSRPPSFPNGHGVDHSYSAMWLLTDGGRSLHLESLDWDGGLSDWTLCGVRLWNSSRNRNQEADACRKCYRIAERHDALGKAQRPEDCE